jgi:tetratricopeptide (TPR) repeat protein
MRCSTPSPSAAISRTWRCCPGRRRDCGKRARHYDFTFGVGGAAMNLGFARTLGSLSFLVALTLALPAVAQSSVCFTASGQTAIADCTRRIESGEYRGKTLAIYYYNRGYEYKDLAQLDLALQDFNQAIRLNSTYVKAYMHRGDAYRKKGQFERAIADFDRALRLEPDNEYRDYAVEGRDKAREKNSD